MPFTSGEIETLSCPRCRGSLRAAGDGLACRSCSAGYEVQDGVPDLLPWSGGEPGREWDRWREKLDLLQQWRRSTWDRSEAADSRQELADDLAARFFEFVCVPAGGSVLEIGCGSGELRRFLTEHRYWGLDPLVLAPAGPAVSGAADDTSGAVFLRGVGECLPVVDGAFDAVVLCETLDHCLDATRVIREARRVLRPGGLLGVMQSLRVASPPPPAVARARAAAGKLKSRLLGRWRPEDADTKTHPLERSELTLLVESEFSVESHLDRESVLYLRAVKREGPAERTGTADGTADGAP